MPPCYSPICGGIPGLAERLPCARVVHLLDEFFTILARVTVAFGGQVFHMAGDGMMAGFGSEIRGGRMPAQRSPPATRCFSALRR
jgi:class 3 adenylate cyclase